MPRKEIKPAENKESQGDFGANLEQSLRDLLGDAVHTLKESMLSPNPQVRVRAASKIVDTLAKLGIHGGKALSEMSSEEIQKKLDRIQTELALRASPILEQPQKIESPKKKAPSLEEML